MTVKTSEKAARLPPEPPVIPDEAFGELMVDRSQALLGLVSHLDSRPWDRPIFTRPLLGELLHQSTELEELLDAYGASNNERWRPYRSTVAAAKLFAKANYVLLHIRHSLAAYRLLPVEGDFAAETAEATVFAGRVLVRIARRIRSLAEPLGLAIPAGEGCGARYGEPLPPGRLRHDRKARKAGNAGEIVTYLATEFLKQAAESDLLHVPVRVSPSDYAHCVPETVSEEELRRLQHQFHNLQSLYDTFVSDTDTERENPDLPVLRGHVSVIFHLLETATGFAHYYERHVMGAVPTPGLEPLVDRDELLGALMQYSLLYASRYLICARDLCQDMLKRYAEIGRIEAPGPRYRGFHVRPSTLVAKIVHHYGSEVQMELEGEIFDASSPLDIFRANEKINRRKRRWLTSHLCKLPCLKEPELLAQPMQAVRLAVLALAEQGDVVIYQRPLPVQPADEDDKDKTTLQYVLDEVKRLQATGVIDIETEIRVSFIGDKRVLKDLELLADSGYGEDNFGNNVPLPKEIAYLRR